MINNKLIEIEQIKNLNAIYFYNLVPETSLDKKLLGLKVTYNNNQVLEYKYTDEYFEDFVIKVLETYQTEQNKHNIIILNDFTKEIIEKYSKLDFKEPSEIPNANESSINLINNDDFNIKLLEDFFKDIISSLLSLYFNEEIKINNLKGYRNHYTIEYEVNEEKKFIPIIITSSNNYTYSFRINNINNIIMSLNGNLKINDNYIECKYSNKDNSIIGNYFYHVNKDKCENYILYNNKPCYIKKNKNEITPEEENLINLYLNYLGIDTYDSISKITTNDYILCKNISNEEETHQIFCHIRITPNLVRIIKTTKQGIMQYDEQFLISFEEAKEETIFKLINNKELDTTSDYILVQTKYLPTAKSRGNYKTKLCNKYIYKLLEVPSNTKLNTIFNITDTTNLDSTTEYSQVKKLIKERK